MVQRINFRKGQGKAKGAGQRLTLLGGSGATKGWTMNKQRKKQIEWWASKIEEQANEYADVAVKTDDLVASDCHAIAVLAQQLRLRLQGNAN